MIQLKMSELRYMITLFAAGMPRVDKLSPTYDQLVFHVYADGVEWLVSDGIGADTKNTIAYFMDIDDMGDMDGTHGIVSLGTFKALISRLDTATVNMSFLTKDNGIEISTETGKYKFPYIQYEGDDYWSEMFEYAWDDKEFTAVDKVAFSKMHRLNGPTVPDVNHMVELAAYCVLDGITMTCDSVSVAVTRDAPKVLENFLLRPETLDVLVELNDKKVGVKCSAEVVRFNADNVLILATAQNDFDKYPAESLNEMIDVFGKPKYTCEVSGNALAAIISRVTVFIDPVFDERAANIVFSDTVRIESVNQYGNDNVSVKTKSKKEFSGFYDLFLFERALAVCTDSVKLYIGKGDALKITDGRVEVYLLPAQLGGEDNDDSSDEQDE
jgi:hypothetical protein